MFDAMKRHKEFDGFIIDESDRCILKKGSIIVKETNRVLGFWHLLSKRTVLLTASTCHALEDLINRIYKVRLSDFIDIKSNDEDAVYNVPEPSIEYIVTKEYASKISKV